MTASRSEVERIARLAALDLDEESLPALTRQIGRILEYVSRLEAVESGARMPGLSHPPGLRADVARKADAALQPGNLTQAFKDGLFLVPRLGGVGGGGGATPEDDE